MSRRSFIRLGFRPKSAGDLVGLCAQCAKHFFFAGKLQKINGRVRAKEIIAARHVAAAGDELKICDRSTHPAGKPFDLAGDITWKELAVLLLVVVDDVGKRGVLWHGYDPDLEQALPPVAVDEFGLRARRGWLDGHLPFLFRKVKTVIDIRVAERPCLRKAPRRQEQQREQTKQGG